MISLSGKTGFTSRRCVPLASISSSSPGTGSPTSTPFILFSEFRFAAIGVRFLLLIITSCCAASFEDRSLIVPGCVGGDSAPRRPVFSCLGCKTGFWAPGSLGFPLAGRLPAKPSASLHPSHAFRRGPLPFTRPRAATGLPGHPDRRMKKS